MKPPGDPNCLKCHGEGIVLAQASGPHPPVYARCACALQKDIADNVERGMARLMDAHVVKSSALSDHTAKDLWITATKTVFTAHLRHVAIRRPPTWYFKVVSDADVVTAWLASVALKGGEIFDADAAKEAAKVSLKHLTIVDLVIPPELLIIRMGVKTARNVATPEVFLEALNEREQVGKVTWVWDTPDAVLPDHHLLRSAAVLEHLSTWHHLVLAGGGGDRRSPTGFTEMGLGRNGAIPSRQTLSEGQPAAPNATTEWETPRDNGKAAKVAALAAHIAELTPEALETLRGVMETRGQDLRAMMEAYGLDTSMLPPRKGSAE